MEYYKDGKTIRLNSLFDDGEVGEKVIFDHVSFGEKPDLEKYPIARYPLRTVFTIVKKQKIDRHNYSYVLRDQEGYTVELVDGFIHYLYDLEKWALFQYESAREHLARKDGRNKHLESQIDLLTDILVKQGVRVISEAQAEKLGIK